MTQIRTSIVEKLMKEYDWNSLLQYNHVEMYHKLVTELNNIYPQDSKQKVLKRRNPKNEWIDGEIFKLCDEKEEIWKRCQKELGNQNLKEEYRRVRNKVTAKLRPAKNRYYVEKFSINKKNMKHTWRMLNQFIGKQRKRSINDTIISNFKNRDVHSLNDKFNDRFIQAIEALGEQRKYYLRKK